MKISTRDGASPWRNEEELSRVRDQLFSGKRKGEADEREYACKVVSVWRIRGGLPHAGMSATENNLYIMCTR